MRNVWIHTARLSLVLLLGLICTAPVSGKESSDPITVKQFPCEKDSLLNCTIDYLMDEGYRIRSVDSDAGFICADRFIPHNSLLSVKKGERRTVNFIIRKCGEGEQGSCVRLSILYEDWNWAGNLDATSNYYYEDMGVLTAPEAYEMVWEGLQNKLQQSDEQKLQR